MKKYRWQAGHGGRAEGSWVQGHYFNISKQNTEKASIKTGAQSTSPGITDQDKVPTKQKSFMTNTAKDTERRTLPPRQGWFGLLWNQICGEHTVELPRIHRNWKHTNRENCCRHCFRTNCGTSRKQSAAQQDPQSKLKCLCPHEGRQSERLVKENPRRQWTGRGIRKEGMHRVHCLWVARPFCATVMVETRHCTLEFLTSANSCCHLWGLNETMYAKELFQLSQTHSATAKLLLNISKACPVFDV